jgi:hypothetical protein
VVPPNPVPLPVAAEKTSRPPSRTKR